jgi:hypothetical protein
MFNYFINVNISIKHFQYFAELFQIVCSMVPLSLRRYQITTTTRTTTRTKDVPLKLEKEKRLSSLRRSTKIKEILERNCKNDFKPSYGFLI